MGIYNELYSVTRKYDRTWAQSHEFTTLLLVLETTEAPTEVPTTMKTTTF